MRTSATASALAICSFGVSGSSDAQPANAEVFIGYDEFCGLPVVMGADRQLASARRDQLGRPFIHVDPGVVQNRTASRVFAIAHECAHHKIGHTTLLGQAQRYSGGTRTQELQADCWAAKALLRVGYTLDIHRTVQDNVLQGHFSANGYPTGAERADLIRRCVAPPPSDECEEVRTPCHHRVHPRGDAEPCTHVVATHPRGDIGPCGHACMSPFGPAPCHPRGDIFPCAHLRNAHRFDTTPCSHPSHPDGHVTRSCNGG